MAITFKCTQCGHELTVPDELAGRTGRCARCGTRITVPSAHDGFLPDAAGPTPAQPLGPLPPPSPFTQTPPPRPLPETHVPGGPYVPYDHQRVPGETASGFCSMIVFKLQAVWDVLGWALFGFSLLGGYVGYEAGLLTFWGLVIAIAGPLWLVWWVIDAMDQRISATQFIVGVILLFTCCGGLLMWLYYWFYVRD